MTRSYRSAAFALLAVGFLPIDSPIVWAALGAGAAMLGTALGFEPPGLERRALDRARGLVAPLRRPVAVVAWGGRPGTDLQLGSPEDVDRAYRLLIYARARRRAGAHAAAITAAMGRVGAIGVSVAEANAALAEMAGKLAAVEALQRARYRVTWGDITLEDALERERRRLALTTNAATTLEALEALVRGPQA